jgi:hypothetical protein
MISSINSLDRGNRNGSNSPRINNLTYYNQKRVHSKSKKVDM